MAWLLGTTQEDASPTLSLYLDHDKHLPHPFLLLKYDPFFQVTVESGLPSFEPPGAGGAPKNSACKKNMPAWSLNCFAVFSPLGFS